MDYYKTLNRIRLKQMVDEGQDFVLIDVLPPEFYQDVHIAGAVNACVYDVDFLQQVEALVGSKERTLVVYCNSATSQASDVAKEKLNRAGYNSVFVYKGGTTDWRRAGNAVEGAGLDKILADRVEDRIYNIDPEQCVIEWIGRNITGSHYGTLRILSGSIPVRRSAPVNASFVIDMNSIENLDLQDPTLNAVLVAHLKSDDFFDVASFPQARFESTSFTPIQGAKAGGANYEVTGKLTIKDVTRDITFPAVVSLREDRSIVAEAHFDFDRTLWNVNYGSGKFFERLGKHLVYDCITLQMKLVAV